MATEQTDGVTYARNAGNSGGCIEARQTRTFENHNALYFIASPMFAGNRSAAFGGQLTFDIFMTLVDPKQASASFVPKANSVA